MTSCYLLVFMSVIILMIISVTHTQLQSFHTFYQMNVQRFKLLKLKATADMYFTKDFANTSTVQDLIFSVCPSPVPALARAGTCA